MTLTLTKKKKLKKYRYCFYSVHAFHYQNSVTAIQINFGFNFLFRIEIRSVHKYGSKSAGCLQTHRKILHQHDCHSIESLCHATIVLSDESNKGYAFIIRLKFLIELNESYRMQCRRKMQQFTHCFYSIAFIFRIFYTFTKRHEINASHSTISTHRLLSRARI